MSSTFTRSALLAAPSLALALAAPLAACGVDAVGESQAVGGDAAATAPIGAPTADAAPVAVQPSPTDGGTQVDAPSRCKVTPEKISCTHQVTKLTAGLASRDVYWQTPSTPPPAGGYPVVVLFQGSLGGPSLTWQELTPGTPFGGYHQARLQAMLLDHGFTVIAPEAAAGIAWQTNSGVPYELTTDKAVIDRLLTDIGAGQFGPANPARVYATGISSGGYMTSRMAVSHAGKFRALAIQSGSYATCAGALCNVPSLPTDHPPTLFLHGELDLTVPLFTAERYHDALIDDGREAKKVVDPAAGHEWLSVAPEEITEWFESH